MSVQSIEVKASDAASMVQLLLSAGAYVIGGNGSPSAAEGLIIHQIGMREFAPANGGAPQSAMFYMVAFRDDCDPELRDDVMEALEPYTHTGAPLMIVSGGVAFSAVNTVRPVPARFAKLALLASGWLGPQITTVEAMDAAILAQISAMVPAGLAREAAKLAWLGSKQFERDNPTLAAMSAALGKTPEQVDALFESARQMQRAEDAAKVQQGQP